MLTLVEIWQKVVRSKKINEKGCWIYTGNICSSTGYGRIQIQGKRWHVHRISCAVNHGLNLDDNKQFACHKLECNDRKCFNPDHLYVGDNQSNQLDVIQNQCKKGHPFIGDSYRINAGTGRRICVICEKEYKLSMKAASAVNR